MLTNIKLTLSITLSAIARAVNSVKAFDTSGGSGMGGCEGGTLRSGLLNVG